VIKMLSEGLITIKMAKEIIPDLLSGRDPEAVVTERGWRVVRDVEELRSVVRQVFAENEKAVRDALRNKRAIQHLIGKAMERTGKRADPRVLRAIVEEMLERARAELEEEGPGAS
ncbi:MAG: Asp-tRNA(Asn)/Glu-tRNA(Gln) amidotransferase GatCAB subunit B, partial [Fervidicoccaceae archaeon]